MVSPAVQHHPFLGTGSGILEESRACALWPIGACTQSLLTESHKGLGIHQRVAAGKNRGSLQELALLPHGLRGKRLFQHGPRMGLASAMCSLNVPLRMAPGCPVGIQQVLSTALRALDRAASGFRGGGNNSSSLTWPLLFLDLNSLHYQIKDLTEGGHFFMQ